MLVNDYMHLTEEFEGFRRYPYRDTVGKLTVGFGFNLDDVGLSKAESKAVLARRLAERHERLSNELDFYDDLSETRQYVLVDMSYNLGFAGLMGFKNMLGALADGRYNEAADEMENSRWYEQVGRRATILVHMMRNNTVTPYNI